MKDQRLLIHRSGEDGFPEGHELMMLVWVKFEFGCPKGEVNSWTGFLYGFSPGALVHPKCLLRKKQWHGSSCSSNSRLAHVTIYYVTISAKSDRRVKLDCQICFSYRNSWFPFQASLWRKRRSSQGLSLLLYIIFNTYTQYFLLIIIVFVNS